MAKDPVEQLERAFTSTGTLITGIAPEQWAAATPCPAWSVSELVEHLVGGNLLVASALSGGEPRKPPVHARIGQELVDAYDVSARAVVSAFRQPGTLGKVVAVPLGSVPGHVALALRVTEILVHGWDVGRATGQSLTFPEDVVENAFRFSTDALPQMPPDRRPFASPKPVADDALFIDRLAALLGRDVDPVTVGAT